MQQSPFENIFSMIGGLSQGNEKPMKHGFYNAFALLLLGACCAALYVLFLILEPFFKPLFWALLVGSLLHPFKHRLSKQLKTWFDDLERSQTCVLLGIAIIPINLVNNASNTIGSQFKEHYKMVLCTATVVFIMPWLYSSVPRALPCLFWQCLHLFCSCVKLLISIFNPYVTFTAVIGYFIAMYSMWSPERAGLFRKGSLLMWLCGSSYLASLTGTWQVYAFVVMQLLALAGFIVEVLDIHKDLVCRDTEASIMTSVNMALSNTRPQNLNSSDSSDTTKVECETPKPKTEYLSSPEQSITDSPISKDKGDIAIRRIYKQHTLSSIPLNTNYSIKNEYFRNIRKSLNENDLKNTFSLIDNEDETALYFKLLFFGCTCVLIWKHLWLLPMSLFFLSIHLIKNIGHFFNVWSFVQKTYDNVVCIIKDWWGERSAAMVPAHLRGVARLAGALNRSARAAAYESVDTVSSCIVILALILFLLSASIFLVAQIYSEGVVVVQLSGSVLNSSAVRDSALWGHLPAGWEDSLDSLFDNAYTYGREGLSKVVRSVLKEGEEDKVLRVETQVLELWDRVYQSWMAGPQTTHGPRVDSRAVQDSWDNFLTDITKTPGIFNYAGMAEWLQANVGTLTAVAGSVWAPLASNVSLLAGSLGAIVSVLLCGGTAILNFIFSLVVFFTSLFYLLASSGSLYKPVEVITQTQPNLGPKLGIALSVAINQVFRASFKMALFYGLWTWLVHNLFDAKVIYLPSVLAAVLGAAPFLGTWLACVPAVLDVWLAQARPLAAVALAAAQFAPVSFVDAAVYKEIRNGGHPYLTGLAIAGGLFFFGPEGAILGPLLLCCLLVVFNLSSAFLRDTPADERAAAAAAALQSRLRMGIL